MLAMKNLRLTALASAAFIAMGAGMAVAQSNVVIMQDPGGGYGDALQRDPIRVEDDLREGKVTAEGAARDYGVVFAADGATIDLAATTRRRAERAGAKP